MIDKEKLDIDECFSAESVREAKQYLTVKKIDIVLCDIEMPQESGLELLEWIGRQSISVEFIIMTCFAEFEYAKRAVSLGSHAYLLKPIDREELERELLGAIHMKSQKDQLKQHSYSWIRNQDIIREKFWLKLFRGEIRSVEGDILQWLRVNKVEINQEWSYCPILIVVRRWGASVPSDDYNLFRFALKNILIELFTEDDRIPVFDLNQLGSDVQLVVVGYDDREEEISEGCVFICKKFLQTVKNMVEVSIDCYIGKKVALLEMASEIENLHQMDYNNLLDEGVYNLVEFVGMKTKRVPEGESSEFEKWLKLLTDGRAANAENKINHYLEYQTKGKAVNREWLVMFQYKYMIMLGLIASQKKYYLNQILMSDEASELLAEAVKGITEMKKWVHYSLYVIEQLDNNEIYSKDPIKCTKKYVEEHLADELDMEKIAQNVHLNPDYLTRIFRKATGESVNKYIVSQRMEKAKQLLELTNQPLSEVAFQVGYFNYTSFNHIFTRSIGVSPQTYRHNYRKN